MDTHDRRHDGLFETRLRQARAGGRSGGVHLGRLRRDAALGTGDKINSKINGVTIGAITYSFSTLSAEDVLKAYTTIGLGEMELMSNHAEALAGMPARRRGRRRPARGRSSDA